MPVAQGVAEVEAEVDCVVELLKDCDCVPDTHTVAVTVGQEDADTVLDTLRVSVRELV